jgi:hypothetical protein
MPTEPWPIAYLRPRNVTRHISPRTTAGTVSASGFTQRVSVPAQSWTIVYGNILVATAEQLRVWDAYEGYLQGGAVPVLVPLVGEADISGTIGGTVVGATAAGATFITIHRVGAAVVAGMHFSIGERLYRCFGTTSVGGDNYTMSVLPPLREAAAGGAVVVFDNPAVRCRLASDDEMTLQLEPGRMGTATVRFVEDPNDD